MIKNMNVTRKLFIVTALVFSVFIVGTLIIQSVFFESFYIYKKKSDLRINIEKFKTDYNKNLNNSKKAEIIGEYEESADIKIMIMDELGNLKFITQPYKGRVELSKIRELTDFVKVWREDPINLISIKQENKPVIVSTKPRESAERKLITILANSEQNEIIFAMSSMQPVSEAVKVIEKLYVYFFIGAILLVILLSFIYSNMIAKPLININKAATKMAKLDFSEKCIVMSNDEIGNVASSLNFLSENLNDALTSLREANAKLEEDIDKERKLEKMRKEFIASVSHELKTPITLISGYAIGLKDDIFEQEEKEFYLNVIVDEAEKMGNLVSDMLDLSQLESGNFKLSREEFIITDLLEFTVKKYSGLADEKSVQMAINLIDNIKVCADWNRIEQVITNFITNALRHVNPGGNITISMVEKLDGISIEFENTGRQIDEKELSKIWDKFYKIDKSRNRKLGGTGIGLSIVKNILLLHNYSFGVENTLNGVKFYFTVPKTETKQITGQ